MLYAGFRYKDFSTHDFKETEIPIETVMKSTEFNIYPKCPVCDTEVIVKEMVVIEKETGRESTFYKIDCKEHGVRGYSINFNEAVSKWSEYCLSRLKNRMLQCLLFYSAIVTPFSLALIYTGNILLGSIILTIIFLLAFNIKKVAQIYMVSKIEKYLKSLLLPEDKFDRDDAEKCCTDDRKERNEINEIQSIESVLLGEFSSSMKELKNSFRQIENKVYVGKARVILESCKQMYLYLESNPDKIIVARDYIKNVDKIVRVSQMMIENQKYKTKQSSEVEKKSIKIVEDMTNIFQHLYQEIINLSKDEILTKIEVIEMETKEYSNFYKNK